MLRSTFIIALLSTLAPHILADDDNTPMNTLTAAEKEAGFILLFDGKTLDGWRGYKSKQVPSGWKVIDGHIARVGGGGDIITDKQFGSFELHVDWKVAPKGNSGIMYHVEEGPPNSYMTGPEFQVLDNKGHADGRNKLTSAGACYGLYAPVKDASKPAGEWNHAKIIIRNGHVEHWLNGEKVVEYVKGSEEWNKKIAASKFRAWPEFGKPTRGHICLQDHGDKVEYRNLKIRILDD
ncbi:MAG TPA: DUF1080 domain-containing protein [Gemmatales bacterium]|nr:DUF1080 domain-containing protein [Gemmatales bacterium]